MTLSSQRYSESHQTSPIRNPLYFSVVFVGRLELQDSTQCLLSCEGIIRVGKKNKIVNKETKMFGKNMKLW